ncbi:hypothetical protein [Nitrosomonas marina]|uniref:Uncharacterized protein n=1 Tax=Nitrosomonas marina TaxID=917 RepID=A0A1H8IJ92_9PROT|nr:hypothetical protein [Nitrosomonas marina]SEN67967.1 hypothetical protein SAMN05216325_1336 [Nitrosomonas marina]
MSRENIVHDVRHSFFGHNIEYQWGSDDPTKVMGCISPLPIPGDYVISKAGKVHEFIDVEPMRNPHDGFFATIKSTGIAVNEDKNPTYADIKGRIKSITQDQHSVETQ